MSYAEQQPKQNIVLLGGGGGLSVMAEGLVESMPDVSVTAGVAATDDGSATGEDRRVFGGPAVGDMRKVMGAVSGTKEIGQTFAHRFGPEDTIDTVREISELFLSQIAINNVDTERVSSVLDEMSRLSERLPALRGHTFGNLVLTALRLDHEGNLSDAGVEAGQWLGARAKVFPITNGDHTLMMFDGRELLRGEHIIDEHTVADPKAAEVWLTPDATISPVMFDAIANADAVIVGPGSLFTSLLPVLAPRGIKKALEIQRRNGGSLVAVSNLVHEEATSQGMDVCDYIAKLTAKTGRRFDYLIYNQAIDALPGGQVALRYEQAQLDKIGAMAIGANLVDARIIVTDPNDPIAHTRSTVQHNSHAVASAVQTQILGRHNTLLPV